MTDVVLGADGRRRCSWPGADPLYVAYHDTEWGNPVHGERELYERLVLEGFQSGLAWITILRKRDGFRRAFAGFDPEVVASFDDSDTERLMADPSIVRNRAKIRATITNARAVLDLRHLGGLDALVWSHAPAAHQPPSCGAELRATSPESLALSSALKKHGFSFVGPTTMYAAMQACGLVNDHLPGCFRA